MSDKPVRVRFAPSPTGSIHIGGVRTALFNWFFARQQNGAFILRIEDTDQKRYTEGAVEAITDGLRWLGLNWDEGPEVGGDKGPYFQSQRLDLYREWAEWLVVNDKAYRCYTTSEELAEAEAQAKKRGLHWTGYDRRHRDISAEERQQLHETHNGVHVIRFKMPIDGTTRIHDIVRGDIVFDNKQLTDLVLLKSDGYPTYHLANVVDDHFMEISHIMRGEEWIPTAPVHRQLYDAFGWEMPHILHLPVILNPNGKGKMSKRYKLPEGVDKFVPVMLSEYIDAGYLPEALVNFLTNVGWAFGDDREVFTVEETIERFDLSRINPAGSAFPDQKLEWINGVYIRELASAELTKRLKPFLDRAGLNYDDEKLAFITPHIQARLKTLDEVVELTRFLWVDEFVPAPTEDLIPKKMDAVQTKAVLQAVYDTLAALPSFDWAAQEEALRKLADEKGITAGQLFNPIRVATSAQNVAPPLFQSMQVLGKAESLRRLQLAIDALETHIVQPS